MTLISVQAFYDLNLKNGSARDIYDLIQSLRQSVLRQRQRLPREFDELAHAPSVRVEDAEMLARTREYLAATRARFAELDAGTSPMTSTEIRDLHFTTRMAALKRATFDLTAHERGQRVVVELTPQTLRRYNLYLPLTMPRTSQQIAGPTPIRRAQFRQALTAIHLGEWANRYAREAASQVQWRLALDYGFAFLPVTFSGRDRFPYNFTKLIELFNMPLPAA
ncbi:hypothetical protein [Lacticaseibacillus daqingensis]|uniref:hypothetical protein n=1 Tax=Lacticaseibacillus daqingensis TaxID=2486014 RepID=UPI000F7A3BC0|nr:hypothetical protein [Lacticaseibacillus daqingensis]